jgi:hypothetical protein
MAEDEADPERRNDGRQIFNRRETDLLGPQLSLSDVVARRLARREAAEQEKDAEWVRQQRKEDEDADRRWVSHKKTLFGMGAALVVGWLSGGAPMSWLSWAFHFGGRLWSLISPSPPPPP